METKQRISFMNFKWAYGRMPTPRGSKLLLTLFLLLILLVACTSDRTPATTSANSGSSPTTTSTQSSATTATTSNSTATPTAATTVELSHSPTHTAQPVDNSSSTQITLNGSQISVEGPGVTVADNIATITQAGHYEIQGNLSDGRIIVETNDSGLVQLTLNNATLHSSSNAPLSIMKAETVYILLADSSVNTLTDTVNYVFPSADEDEPKATLFSKADMTIGGSGTLNITAAYNDAISSKDGLIIEGGVINIVAADDGIRGKDYLIIRDTTITLQAADDGLKADNEDDSSKGFVILESGTFNITVGGDAIQAETDLSILSGEFTITTGGGSRAVISEEDSAKGLKAERLLVVEAGTFNINSADDAIHSNAEVLIKNGTFALATADDAIHAETNLTVEDGTITITESYEGLEAMVITINGGYIDLTSSDDGLNAAGGEGETTEGFMGRGPGGFGGGQQDTPYTGPYHININGGTIIINAQGDGVDSNGAITMNGGLLLVHGPTASGNGALDYDGTFTINSGIFIAVGSAGMAQTAGTLSSQPSVLINFNAALPAGDLINLQNSNGQSIFTFAPDKQIQSIAFSSPELSIGSTYELFYGGTATGTSVGGLYVDGSYSDGSSMTTITLSNIVTQLGSRR